MSKSIMAAGGSKEAEAYSVSFSDPEWASKGTKIFKREGVLVLNDVFSNERCDEVAQATFDSFQKLNPKITYIEGKKDKWTLGGWTRRNLPVQTRAGMFQRGPSGFKCVWDVRSDPTITDIYRQLYSRLREKDVDKTYVSVDGINFKPPQVPYQTPDTKPWTHFDQQDGPFDKCIQGQCVFTDTTAGFRCCTRSHLLHADMLDKFGKRDDKKDWWMLANHKEAYDYLKTEVKKAGGEFHKPIIAPKGSMIFWFSATAHSAKLPEEKAVPPYLADPKCKWNNWRCVYYVSHRPCDEVEPEYLNNVHTAFRENRTTNHWGKEIFRKTLFRHNPADYEDCIEAITQDPVKLYDIADLRPELTDEIKELIGLE